MQASGRQLGRQSHLLPTRPRIRAFASTVGKKEGEGPLHGYFDAIIQDDTLGEKTWEKAERKMLTNTVSLALYKAGLVPDQLPFFLGGDLLNQIVSAGFAARELHIPFLGQYGACSTMAQSLALGAMLLDGGFGTEAVCASCSHFSTAERQYRFPLELGNVRPPYAQWTVTGAGATVLTTNSDRALPVCVESVTLGRVVDLEQDDENHMGAAMAPAAADTLLTHLSETGRSAEDYDLIITGDLGRVGFALFRQLCDTAGVRLPPSATDCGIEIFGEDQGTYAGGSGCGCSAAVLNSALLTRLCKGELERVLFMATGALLSPTTTLQGESIPGIAHAVSLQRI